MRKVCTKMVQKNLTTEQKANRRDRLEREPEFFSCIITGEESWILEYNPETKRQSWEWHTANSPRPKKARMSKSKIKSMLICFFLTVRGIVHEEFVPPGQTVNPTFYREVLERLRKMVARAHVTWQSPSMNFCQKNAFLWFLSPPIRRISVPVTSFYSPRSKTT